MIAKLRSTVTKHVVQNIGEYIKNEHDRLLEKIKEVRLASLQKLQSLSKVTTCCSTCNTPETSTHKLIACPCKGVFYCNSACKTKDWGKHKDHHIYLCNLMEEESGVKARREAHPENCKCKVCKQKTSGDYAMDYTGEVVGGLLDLLGEC